METNLKNKIIYIKLLCFIVANIVILSISFKEVLNFKTLIDNFRKFI